MIKKTLTCFVAIPLLALAASAQAHDPKEHMKSAEKPNCAAMSDMDHSNMDMNDPVALAMMKKCSGANQSDNDDQAEKPEKSNAKPTGDRNDSPADADAHHGH